MSSINASVGSGIAYNSDSTATLQLGTAGAAAVSIDASQNTSTTNNLTVGKNLIVSGNISLATGGNITLTSNVSMANSLVVSGNIFSGGSPVPNMTQLYTYTLALG